MPLDRSRGEYAEPGYPSDRLMKKRIGGSLTPGVHRMTLARQDAAVERGRLMAAASDDDGV